MRKDNIIRIYEKSFREHRELPALTDYFGRETFSYYETAKEVAKLHMFFSKAGIKKGDRIAIVGRNTPRWAIAHTATLTYGAVCVPILHDFSANDISHLINHSEAKLLFAGDNHWDMVDGNLVKNIRAAISLTDFSCLYERYGNSLTDFQNNILIHYRSAYPKGFTSGDISYGDIPDDTVAVINYTSGTTGFSKGVMLTIGNITANVVFALGHEFHRRNSNVLSLLPLAHTYGCVFDMMTALAAGSHITLLGKAPAPKTLVEAMQDVRPDVICTVPIVFDKIVRKHILPLLDTRLARAASKTTLGDSVVSSGIRKKMMSLFGGEIKEVIIGGTPASREITDLVYRIKFPLTVGYGMTECGPLISYSPNEEYIPGTCGKVVPGMEIRIDSADPQNIPGEILVRGGHVMAGYYRNDEANARAFDAEGWLHTGDIGTLAPDGTLAVRGRCNYMIPAEDGASVCPEEIESRLNIMNCVMESLVVRRNGKLVAFVVPDYEQADSGNLTMSSLKKVMKENLDELNSLLPPFEQVSDIILYPEEFEKTPKKSIKRFIYTG